MLIGILTSSKFFLMTKITKVSCNKKKEKILQLTQIIKTIKNKFMQMIIINN